MRTIKIFIGILLIATVLFGSLLITSKLLNKTREPDWDKLHNEVRLKYDDFEIMSANWQGFGCSMDINYHCKKGNIRPNTTCGQIRAYTKVPENIYEIMNSPGIVNYNAITGYEMPCHIYVDDNLITENGSAASFGLGLTEHPLNVELSYTQDHKIDICCVAFSNLILREKPWESGPRTYLDLKKYEVCKSITLNKFCPEIID